MVVAACGRRKTVGEDADDEGDAGAGESADVEVAEDGEEAKILLVAEIGRSRGGSGWLGERAGERFGEKSGERT